MRTLYLLRHAKAEQGNALLVDEDRPLAPRGREACERIGEYMKAKSYWPNLVLCSSSARTRETLKLVSEHYGKDFPVTLEKKLYLATPGEMLAQIHNASDEAASLMLVGHNPGMHHLAALLASTEHASAKHNKLRMELDVKYPTGALCVIEFDAKHWNNIAPDSGVLTDYVTPSSLK